MILLHEYNDSLFIVGLCIVALFFTFIEFVLKNPCKIVNQKNKLLEFIIQPIIFYFIAIISVIIGFFLAFCFVTGLTYPNTARLTCNYDTIFSIQQTYSCKYTEYNLQFQTSISFKKIDKVALHLQKKDDSFSRRYDLRINSSEVERNPHILKIARKLEYLFNLANIDSSIEQTLKSKIIVFPLKIEQKDYKYWLNKKQKISDFTAKSTNHPLIINQELAEAPMSTLTLLDFAIKTLLWFSLVAGIICFIAPTIECKIDVEQNTFRIKRKRFFTITTYVKEISLNEVRKILLKSSQDKDSDSFGSRLVLLLKSGEEIPITYTFENIGVKANVSKLKACQLANDLIESIHQTQYN